jgi:C-terminal processing protease CtpA/Prc
VKRFWPCVAIALAFLTRTAQPVAAAPNSEMRLLAAMKLWGDVKLFDPEAANGRVDWDSAFVRAEPAVAAAASAESYRNAIATLLEPLADPATHVNREPGASNGRLTVSLVGTTAVVTIPHGVTADEAQLATDAARAFDVASKSRDVLFDLRGLNESNESDGDALRYFFSGGSPMIDLFKGEIALPRERSRSYLGYPGQRSGGYAGYSAQDRISDAVSISGKSSGSHRFGFLVDGATSLPSIALALASKGDAAIYSTGGSPAILAPSVATIDLTQDVSVTYRTSDLADIDPQQQFASRTVAGVRDAVTALDSQSPAEAAYVRPPPETTKDRPYADRRLPGEAMRMLAIARIYNVIRYFSPYRSLMHDDWDAAALQAIRDERTAGDARSYVLGLMRFYAHLHDSHGYVGGDVVNTEFGAGVPLEARYLHAQVVVTQLFAGEGASHGIRVGDVIDDIDGVPVRSAMNRIERYICSSTQQSADYSALATSMQPSVFTGRLGSDVTLRFHHSGGTSSTATFMREFVVARPSRFGPKYSVLAGNVGYVDFDRLDPSEVDPMFEALKNTRAIVFDNRGYPRGAAWSIAPRLTAKTSLRLALFDTPVVVQPLDGQLDDISALPAYQEFYQMLGSAAGPKYLKPTVMLVDERAISQSEHSALFFRETAHTLFVGTPTRGANGDVTSMVAPGGIFLYFTGEGVRHADGRQLQRIGILPDVTVAPTASDVATANDVVLQTGLDEALRLAGANAHARAAARRSEIARERTARVAPPPGAGIAVAGVDEKPLVLAWQPKGANYSASEKPSGGYENAGEIALRRAAGDVANGAFGSYAGALDVAPYRGKTVRIRGYIKTDGVSGGAGFWLRIDGPSQEFDNMQDRWSSGTTDWKPFAIVLRVPLDATRAFAGLLLVGSGDARASALTIDVVPDSTPTTGN